MAKVAFLGTGLLGSAMAEGMIKRGDSVTVWNRTEAKARALAGILTCERVGACVEVGDTTVRFVPGGPQGRPELHAELFV